MNKISVVIINKNSMNTISKTLDSVVPFDEIIIYDNGSTAEEIDMIKKYTEKYSNIKLYLGTFEGFGITKNKAASYAKNEWILSLDSDEVIDEKLVEKLKNTALDKNTVYSINIISFYKNIHIKYGGWSNRMIKRIYNKSATSFTNDYVHEAIIFDKMNTCEISEGCIRHYSYNNISEFIIKADRYSTLYANENKGKRKSSPQKAIFNSFYSFIKTYFIKRGFLDGYAGLLIAFSHMVTNFYKYMKLYEANIENENINNKT